MLLGSYSVSSLPAVKFNGTWYTLGCLPETEETKGRFASFRGMFAAPLDPSRWQEIDLSWYNVPVKNQGSTSSCCGQACCAGMELCFMQGGRPLKEFNPYFIYGLINGGRDQGAMISDGLMALQQHGVCLKEDLPKGAMFKNQFPQKAFDNAKRFKLIQAYRCDSFEEICSAISLGYSCALGIMVGDNFPRVDSEGVSPLPAGGGGGHAILGVALKKSSRYGWLIKILNSWGSSFGQNGYSYIRKEHFRSMRPDAFALQVVSDDPLDNTPGDEVPVNPG